MKEKFYRAKQIFHEKGAKPLIGKSLQFVGRSIAEGSETKKKKNVIQNYSDTPRFLNVGGGNFVRDDWRVLDYYSDHYSYDEILIDYPIDLEELEQWPIESESYDLVYSSATLEHLSDDAIEQTLQEAHRILKPGGGIHITVPDSRMAFKKYSEGDIKWMQEIRGVDTEWIRDVRNFNQNGIPQYLEEYTPELFLIRWFASAHLHEEADHDNGFESFLQSVRKDTTELEFEEFLEKYKSKLPVAVHRRHPGGHRNWMTEDRVRSLLSDAGFDEIERVYARQSRFTELCHEEFDPRPQWSVHVEGIKPI
jgi:SAM-dependent methyltransferase